MARSPSSRPASPAGGCGGFSSSPAAGGLRTPRSREAPQAAGGPQERPEADPEAGGRTGPAAARPGRSRRRSAPSGRGAAPRPPPPRVYGEGPWRSGCGALRRAAPCTAPATPCAICASGERPARLGPAPGVAPSHSSSLSPRRVRIQRVTAAGPLPAQASPPPPPLSTPRGPELLALAARASPGKWGAPRGGAPGRCLW